MDDAEIAALHGRWLDDPTPTDVISFPLEDEQDPGPRPLLGEVVVSLETAAREAAARDIPLEEEALRYVVHGALHLLGYDDLGEDERARMHARQEALLAAFLAGRPAPPPG